MGSNIYKQYINNFEENLLNCRLLGKGHNGIVYMLPDGKVIKICFEEKSCRKEYNILKRIRNNKYFPKVYGMRGNYMIRDYVEGTCLTKHIKERGLDKDLALKIVILLEEFKKLKFSKEDIRCKDIMVREDGSLMVIDPKKFYSKKRTFPRHLAKGLYKLGALDDFMEVVKQERPKLYRRWNSKVYAYINWKFGEQSTEE